jgi:quercetin dioxygenase-like cupin family protein
VQSAAPPRLAALGTLETGDPQRYSGEVRLARLLQAGDDTVRVYEVCFAPASRTVWHVHAGEQMLVTLIGHCVVQVAGAPARHLRPGEGVRIPAGVRHWHGALPSGPASHLALNQHGPTVWETAVTDAEFSTAVGRAASGLHGHRVGDG